MSSSDAELRAIYVADQQDRVDQQGGRVPACEVAQRDGARRAQVEALVAGGVVMTADDYFRAAMVFQHGETLEHFWQAVELATQAAELGHESGARLAARAYDRWLMRQGEVQKYGTQYVIQGGEKLLWEVDPATTDQERAAWNVPCLADALGEADGRIRLAASGWPVARRPPGGEEQGGASRPLVAQRRSCPGSLVHGSFHWPAGFAGRGGRVDPPGQPVAKSEQRTV